MLDSNSFRSSTVTFFGSTCGVARYVSCWWRWSDCYGCLHGFHSSLFRPLQFFIPHPRNAVDVISNLPLIGTSQAKFGCLRVITKDEKTLQLPYCTKPVRILAYESTYKKIGQSNRTSTKTLFLPCARYLFKPGLYNMRPAKAFLPAHQSFLNCRKCYKSLSSNK